jgi:hypothetical protein
VADPTPNPDADAGGEDGDAVEDDPPQREIA